MNTKYRYSNLIDRSLLLTPSAIIIRHSFDLLLASVFSLGL